MSDPHQATSSVSYLFESLLSDEGQGYDSAALECIGGGARWVEWSDFDGLAVENGVTSQSDSEKGWGGEDGQARKKRKLAGGARERQRGKNWEKAEEDILVESKRREMDWKSISDALRERGFVRNHKHCADKWYALRKHYLEIHQWMADHPGVSYWDRSDGERIRSVPPSFCQKWYHIFHAAERREGRKKAAQTPRRKPDAAAPPGSSHPSCSLSDALLHLPCPRKLEPCHDDDAALFTPSSPPDVTIQTLVAEIHNLSSALFVKFDAEQKERERNFDIKQRKLELKRQRFDYKRQRDEEKRRTVAQCLNVAVQAYD